MPPYDAPDEEWIDEEDLSADDADAELLVCPTCRKAVHEETQRCPHCGDWITPIYPRGQHKSLFWALVVALLILSLVFWTVF